MQKFLYLHFAFQARSFERLLNSKDIFYSRLNDKENKFLLIKINRNLKYIDRQPTNLKGIKAQIEAIAFLTDSLIYSHP